MAIEMNKPSVEAFFFKRMLQFCLGISLINIVGNIYVGLDFIVNVKWLVLIPTSIFGLIHVNTEKVRAWTLGIVYTLVIFLFIPSGWKTTGGHNYLTLGYVLLVAMSIGFLLKGIMRIVFAILEFGVFISLVYLQYTQPDFVSTVPDQMHIMDLMIQTPIIFFSILYMATAFSEAWRDERRRLEVYSELLEEQNIRLYHISKTDELTGLYNRRYLFEKLESCVKMSKDTTIVMMDIDDFKFINDRYGHLTGDEVIIEVSQTIRKVVGEKGMVGRYGGDEFVIILKECNDDLAMKLTEKIQKRVQSLDLGISKSITVSGGIAHLNADAGLDEALSTADEIMYWVKHNGKGRIVNKDTSLITSDKNIS